ncbi:MAG: hypothetical protein QM692_10740 [Thermomicrobiales bacterium]
MIVFPAFAALVAALCAISLGRDAVRRPRPERLIWTLAFIIFAVAAGTEVLGAAIGWSPLLARLYYLCGAVLVVGVLALGELYLLFPGRLPSYTAGVALLVTALAATIVWSALIDAAQLQAEGWQAIQRGPALIALAVAINAGGTLVLVVGALYSAWAMRSKPTLRRRAAGCVLIAVGTLMVASGGTLTRLGHHEYLYLAMAAGVSVIFAGVMLTRPEFAARSANAAPAATARRSSIVALPRHAARHDSADEGITFVTARLGELDPDALATYCEQWSATPRTGGELTREDARRVWRLRLLLPDDRRASLDALPLPLQAQLAELYDEVWSAPAASRGA